MWLPAGSATWANCSPSGVLDAPTMTLPPGRYTIEAFGDSAIGVGTAALDDHTITVA